MITPPAGQKAKDAELLVNVPGCAHRIPVLGHPCAGEPYMRNGRVAVDIDLGDPIEGTADHEPARLIVRSVTELDELDDALQTARARMALWFADHQTVIQPRSAA